MNNWFRFRLTTVFVAFLGFFGLVAFRLVQLQVLPNSTLSSLSARQFNRLGKKTNDRFTVYDRNGEELAVSLPQSSVFARPKLIKARKKTARELAKHFGGSSTKWLKRLDPKKSFVWVQRQVSDETADRLQKQNLKGVFIERENRRIYPNGELAAHLIGFTNIDGKGLAGAELALNSSLISDAEAQGRARDGRGTPSYIHAVDEDAPDRKEVHLTLDRRLQNVLEEELRNSELETQAKITMGIIMDPFSGEILAMGQTPTFDPNNPNQSPPSHLQNHLVQSLYEPGSTLKTIFAATAIDAGILQPSSIIDCGKGKITFGNTTITEAEPDHAQDKISLEKVIRYSSNVGAVRVGQALGVEAMRETLVKFGLTQKTGLGLPGEAVFSPRPLDVWKPVYQATVAFGQGVSVTPLQVTLAFAPFANGGFRITPRIVKSDRAISLTEERRILSPKTSQAMKEILTSVTESKDGTGVAARVPGYKVAGKTGTGQKYEPGVGYDSKKYFSSFIGFLPADNPELLIGVMVDEPKNNYYGSLTASPLFRRIAERALAIRSSRSDRPLQTRLPSGKPILNARRSINPNS